MAAVSHLAAVAAVAAALVPLLVSGSAPLAGGTPVDLLSARGAGWSPAVPVTAPVVELGRVLDAGPVPETRGGSSDRARDSHGQGPARVTSAVLRRPLLLTTPRRPAGAFRPHQANAPPLQA